MSVRLRLTLWYVAVLCLGLAAFGAAVLWQAQQSAYTALDQSLRQRAQDVAHDLRLGPGIVLRPDAPDESGLQPGATTLWIRVLDPSGRVVVRQGPPLPGLPRPLLATQQAGFRPWEGAGERPVRLYVLPVVAHGRRAATIQVITTTTQIDALRRQLLAAMGLAGGLIVLLAALGGLFLADRALRPVDRLTRVAAQIGAGDLHRRVGDVVWGPGAPRRPRADELGRLARTFDAMLARLEEAGARRRRLTADVAHELCTPIATIASGAELALRQSRHPDEYRVALAHILEESRHMGRVVDDLLLLARADAGRLPLQRELVELDEVCRQAVQALRPLALQREIALTATLPPHPALVLGDELRLGQVIRNLLDNALRHTPPGGAVALTLDAAMPGRDVVVRVDDTGPGIAAEEQERIFERFHRAGEAPVAGPERRGGGSGLGLAICKAIVTAHDGRIGVEGAGTGRPDGPAPGAHVVVVLPGVADAALSAPLQDAPAV